MYYVVCDIYSKHTSPGASQGAHVTAAVVQGSASPHAGETSVVHGLSLRVCAQIWSGRLVTGGGITNVFHVPKHKHKRRSPKHRPKSLHHTLVRNTYCCLLRIELGFFSEGFISRRQNTCVHAVYEKERKTNTHSPQVVYR